MKILTGKLRGQHLIFRPNPHLRPTADKARKAIFDIFQGELENKRVLDLFSGTGALGFEALSQGSERVTFVEQDKAQYRQITENIKRLGLTNQADIFCEDALEALDKFEKSGQTFDFIFLDPPYGDEIAAKSLQKIAQNRLVNKQGFVLLECRKKEDFPPLVGNLKLLRDKRYGQTKILIYGSSG